MSLAEPIRLYIAAAARSPPGSDTATESSYDLRPHLAASVSAALLSISMPPSSIARPRIPGGRNQGLSREVPDRKPTLKGRTASAAGKSASLKRRVGVRFYPRATCLAPALSCRHQHRYVSITSWCGLAYCNTSNPLRPEDQENSSHAHKQDIGAATRRSPKGTSVLACDPAQTESSVLLT